MGTVELSHQPERALTQIHVINVYLLLAYRRIESSAREGIDTIRLNLIKSSGIMK